MQLIEAVSFLSKFYARNLCHFRRKNRMQNIDFEATEIVSERLIRSKFSK